ncbi:hypothetical protein H0H92_011059, partial [Tricholoma furcatifolium]
MSTKGGRTPDAFVMEHFTKVGEQNPKTKHWQMSCKYCTGPQTIEHRDYRCLKHISKQETCPNAPADVRKQALQLLMQKGGIVALAIDDSDDEHTPTQKKRKRNDGSGKEVVIAK